jgi:ribosome modulation factor
MERNMTPTERPYDSGYRAGCKGGSPINRPPMNKHDDNRWLEGWTIGVKEYRRMLPRLGSAFITPGMMIGADARVIRGSIQK